LKRYLDVDTSAAAELVAARIQNEPNPLTAQTLRTYYEQRHVKPDACVGKQHPDFIKRILSSYPTDTIKQVLPTYRPD
jgi:hypothetical protein